MVALHPIQLSEEQKKLFNAGKYDRFFESISVQDPLIMKYFEIEIEFRESNFILCIKLINEVLHLIEENDFNVGWDIKTRLFLFLAIIYLWTGNQTERDKIMSVVDLNSITKNSFEDGLYNHIQGRIESGTGNLEKCHEFLERSIEIFKLLDETYYESLSYIFLAYNSRGDEMLGHAKKAFDLIKLTKHEGLIAAYRCFVGHIYQLIGDFNKAREFNLQASEDAEQLGFKPALANANHCLGFIALEEGKPIAALNRFEKAFGIIEDLLGSNQAISQKILAFRLAGQHQQALELINTKISQMRPDFYGISWYTWTYVQAILTALELKKKELAEELKDQYDENMKHLTEPIHLAERDLVSALILKEEKNLESVIDAKKIFKKLIAFGEDLWFQLRLISIKYLIQILIFEYEIYEHPDLLDEINELVNLLFEIANSQNMMRVRFEAGLMKSKLDLVMGDVNGSRNTLLELLEVANANNFDFFRKKIQEELNDLMDNFSKWVDLVDSGASMQQLVEETKLMNYLTNARQFIDMQE